MGCLMRLQEHEQTRKSSINYGAYLPPNLDLPYGSPLDSPVLGGGLDRLVVWLTRGYLRIVYWSLCSCSSVCCVAFLSIRSG